MKRVLVSLFFIICLGSIGYYQASSQEVSPQNVDDTPPLLLTSIKTPVTPNPLDSNGINSIGNSYVYLNSVISPDKCFVPGKSQTFCFQAISEINDYDYVYYLWQRFPTDWTVNNIYVQGTPYCVNGGTFSTFDWWSASSNEIRITHVRYHHNPTDTCSAYYCFDVTSGNHSTGINAAWISWYWRSSEYGSTPFYPCSSDGYTPSGQPACDQSITPPAYIDYCSTYMPFIFGN